MAEEFHSDISRAGPLPAWNPHSRHHDASFLDNGRPQPRTTLECVGDRPFSGDERGICTQIHRFAVGTFHGSAITTVACKSKETTGEEPKTLFSRHRITASAPGNSNGGRTFDASETRSIMGRVRRRGSHPFGGTRRTV